MDYHYDYHYVLDVSCIYAAIHLTSRSLGPLYTCLALKFFVEMIFSGMTGLPRLSGSLRAFSGVSNTDGNGLSAQQLRDELNWKRQCKKDSETVTWKCVTDLMHSHSTGKNKSKVCF